MGNELRPMASALFAQLHGQPLEDWILDQRDAGKSLRAIAAELRDMTGGAVNVSAQTVLNWSNVWAEDAA